MKALYKLHLLVAALAVAVLFNSCPASALPELTGEAQAPEEPLNRDFPFTLDLRFPPATPCSGAL